MTFPSPKRIELPLLTEIVSLGGETVIRRREIYQRVARHFPEITDEELALPHSKSSTAWENRVQWSRLRLVHNGEILDWREVGRQGIWRITDKGRERVNSEKLPPIVDIEKDGLKTTEEQRRIHTEVQQQLEEIGQTLGKYARQEYRQDIYRYDVVWKDTERIPRATHAFEVQHRGNLVEALGKLKHAHDIWRSYLFVVITSEKDRHRAAQLLQPYFSGMFHEIGSEVTVMTADDVTEIHAMLSKHSDTIRLFIQR